MKTRSLRSRRSIELLVKILAGASAFTGIFFLGWILGVVTAKGIAAINLDFFTKLPPPPGVPGGGMGNAVVGTLLMTLLATLLGVPVGIFAGIHLAEFGSESRFAGAVRFALDILMGTPSIVVGVFVYTLLVVPVGHFSGYAGAVALAILMLPVVARSTEEMLRLVPNTLREAALALGAPQWKVVLGIAFRAARTGLLTGVLLAVARVSGETAPLLFTALNTPYWSLDLSGPTANLTVTIFNYAMSPYADWQQMAWGASLLITLGVLAATLITRIAFREKNE